ncbi:MAG: hydrogenase maturation protease [Zetaproteobacteria bacterium]|nr:hydrogenase maturation protease [Zetaproteobacteria bacterium]
MVVLTGLDNAVLSNNGNIAPVLVFAYGNPGRGDDALGPCFYEALDAMNLQGVECLTDMQLQVEHAMDMWGRRHVLFVDADVSCSSPWQLSPLSAKQDISYSSHALSPAALLYAFAQIYGDDAPESWVLRIRGYSFELGDDLTAAAQAHLDDALSNLDQILQFNSEKERNNDSIIECAVCN